MDDLPDRALRFIRTHGLLSAGARAVVAFSGGPDSVALALTLVSLRDDGRLPLALFLAHLNHTLRGAESERDEAFCRAFADEHALPLSVERAEVRAHAGTHGLSLEAAARELRYAFLGRAARNVGAGLVATGHHADDVAETVLLRLLRGAGLDALGAVAPARPLDAGRPGVLLVRPLLGVPRADLLAYLGRRGQQFCIDSTNSDTRFTRNRVRHMLMPLLEREFPSFSARSLAGLNAAALESAALVESLLDEVWPRLCIRAAHGEVVLDGALLASTPPPVRKAAARRAFRAVCGAAPQALPAERQEEVAALPEKPVGACVALPCGVLARHEHGRVRFYVDGTAGLSPRALCVPGGVDLAEVGLRIEASALPAGSMGPEQAAARATDTDVYLDLAATGGALSVRARIPGDRFHPLGAPAETKLKKFFIDHKVPRGDRQRTPLVVTETGAVAWVVGHRIGQPFKLRDAGRPVLRLRALRLRGKDV